jgi:hypothetical protein
MLGIKRRDTFQEAKTLQPQIGLVLVFDSERGIYLIRHQPVGKPWKFKGRFFYCAKFVVHYEKNSKEREELVAYDPLAEWRGKHRSGEDAVYTPEDLYDAINWPEAGAVYRMGSNFMQKLNLGLMVALVGILCFFVYVMFSSFVGK